MIIMKLNRSRDFIFYILLVFIVGLVYTVTLLPGTGYSGDTAKFQFLGKVLGISHSTGYPTYLVLNHFFTWLFPFGSLAFKANLLSAVFTILGSIVFYKLLHHLLQLDKIIAFCMALIMAFSNTIWSQSIVAEVYSLNLLFVTLVLYYFILWYQTSDDRHFYIACAIYASSFGNHGTMITFLPAIVFMVLVKDWKTFINPKKILIVLSFILISALQYYYLFWRSSNPHTAYLDAKITNFKIFFDFVSGSGWKAKMFSMPVWTVLTEKIPWYFINLLKEFLFLIPLAVYGANECKDKHLNIFLLLSALGNIFYSINYDIPDVFVYFIPSYLIIAIYIGIGIQQALMLIPKSNIIKKCLCIVPAIFVLFNYSTVNQHNNTPVYTEELIKSVGQNAVIISPEENGFYYDKYEYLQYYIIGEDYRKKYNLYVLPLYNESELYTQIQSYLVDHQPIPLVLEQTSVPPGLAVYCTSARQASMLARYGLRTQDLGNGLYQVTNGQYNIQE